MSARARPWQSAAWTLTGLGLFIGFLVATLPAHWLGELMARATQGQWRLQATSGTVWNGSGTLSIRAGGPDAFVTRLNWRLQPWWLVTGKLRAELQSQDAGDLHAELALGYRSLRIQNAAAELPASLAAVIYAPAALFSPTGTLRFSTNDFAIDSSGMSGEAQLRWLGAGGRLGGAAEIGDYLLVVTGQPGGTAFRVDTLRGDIRVDLQGRWQAMGDGAFTLTGAVTASGPREATLAPALAMLNARREGDRQVFQYNARLPWPTWLGGKS
jgi:hypothetical protein